MKIKGFTSAHFVGHSMGAATVAYIAAHHPERCIKAILLSPVPLTPHKGWRRARPKLIYRLINHRFRFLFLPVLHLLFSLAGFPKGLTYRHIFEVFRISNQFSFKEHSQNILNMTQPTALIWCDDDPIIEKEAMRRLSQNLPEGPRLHFSTGGHAPYHHHASLLNKELCPWLKS
jgi:pimeloyl-ACP methyl ester carboxylesterase